MDKVVKRDGRVVDFDGEKICIAVRKAMDDVGFKYPSFVDCVVCPIEKMDKDEVTVEEIQDLVEENLMKAKMYSVAKAYIRYRYDREKARFVQNNFQKRYEQFKTLIEGTNDEATHENSNKDTRVANVMRDYIAGFSCKEMARAMIPSDVMEAHDKGILHFHDCDYSPAMPIHNCELINLEDMLQNGTVINEVQIDKPKSFKTACTITSQISAQVCSTTYGGQTINLSHLAPFVDVSRQKHRKEVAEDFTKLGMDIDEAKVNALAEERLKREIADGIQTLQYQWVTISGTNGQAAFVTLFMHINDVPEGQLRNDLVMLIEEVLKQRIKGVKNKKGAYVSIAFPKLIYVLDENNISEDSEYWWLTNLSAECSSKRLVPDYVSAKRMRELKEGQVVAPMGCRSLLSPWKDENGNYKLWGRFNQGVVTLNLPHVALSADYNEEKFWELLDERLNLCFKGLMVRHNSLKGTKSDIAPILWQNGAIARLKPGETIDKLLYGSYSTISLGYAGLHETVLALTGKSLTSPEGHELGFRIMKKLADTVDKWKKETNIGFALYGTPLENTTDKFARCLKEQFGIVPGITDKGYVTNSYHVTPNEQIDAFTKLTLESEFQDLSLGGCFKYSSNQPP